MYPKYVISNNRDTFWATVTQNYPIQKYVSQRFSQTQITGWCVLVRHFFHWAQDMTFFVCKLITLSFEIRAILLRPRLILYNSLFSFIYGYQQNYDTVTNILIYRVISKKGVIEIHLFICYYKIATHYLQF